MELVTEATLIIFLIVLAIIFIPLLIGMGIAILIAATGLQYFGVVFLTAFAIWIVFFAVWLLYC